MSTSPDDRWHELDRAAYEIPHDPVRLPEREPLLIERLRVAATFGLDDPRLEQSHVNLLHYYYCDASDYTKVEPVCRFWLRLKDDHLTADQHDLHVLYELGASLTMQERQNEAEAQYRRALQLAESELGPDHERTQGAVLQLGQHLSNAKQYAEAIVCGERLLDLRRQGKASRRHDEVTPWFLHGAHKSLGRHADAEALLREELARDAERKPEDVRDARDPRRGMLLSLLADVIAAQGRLDEALAMQGEAIEMVTAAYAAMNAQLSAARAEAERQGLRMAGPIGQHHETDLHRAHADMLRRAGRYDEAEAIYRDELTLLAADADQQPLRWQPPALGRAHRDATAAERRATILAGLAAVIQEAGRPDEATAYSSEAADLQACALALRERANRISHRL
ncbi:MAG: tetratricopeptide repeat protein [Chloroflexi bacterium]|nr:tetratricopeptide repeat protein [Chloroflexota bacterium]